MMHGEKLGVIIILPFSTKKGRFGFGLNFKPIPSFDRVTCSSKEVILRVGDHSAPARGDDQLNLLKIVACLHLRMFFPFLTDFS